MNGQPHVHRIEIRKGFPDGTFQFRDRWYVKYGDQQVTLGVASPFFQRWRNPDYWSDEKREKRTREAIAKVIAKHDRESKKVRKQEVSYAHVMQVAGGLQPSRVHSLPYYVNEMAVDKWPSDD